MVLVIVPMPVAVAVAMFMAVAALMCTGHCGQRDGVNNIAAVNAKRLTVNPYPIFNCHEQVLSAKKLVL